MKSFRSAVLPVMLLSAALPAAAQDGVFDAPVEGARLPLEYYEDGAIKSQIKAGQARLSENGPIVATDVTVEMFGPDGSLDVIVTTDACRYDRKENRAASDAPVHLKKGHIEIFGKGFVWHGEEQRVEIVSDVKVVLDRKGMPARLFPWARTDTARSQGAESQQESGDGAAAGGTRE